jgi:Asp-tRNA(Asn)/Glu-tRNA(Gln) amidotransferase A subunit family amidase
MRRAFGQSVSSQRAGVKTDRADDPDRLDGMPVGLQLVTPRHTEELALKLTRVVVDAIKA